MKCAILWSWSWGTALSQVLAYNNHTPWLWSISEKEVKDINDKRENTTYLPWVLLRENIHCSLDFEEVISGAELVVFALPSHALHVGIEKLKPYYHWQKLILASKWRRKDCFQPLSTLIKDWLGEDIPLVILSWASHAEEVVKEIPTVVVLASQDEKLIMEVKNSIQTSWFRCSLSQEVVWVQFAWALKNIVALASWLSNGLGYWINTRALIFTKGIWEIKKLGEYLWISVDALLSYAGVGDLYVTCSSPLSRNRNAWNAIAKGVKKEDILAWKISNMICEGLYMIDILENFLNENDLELPLTRMLVDIVNYWEEPKWLFDKFLESA